MRDFRYAVRVLWTSPVFATTAILTLALCIGANTAIYTVVDRVLLRPLPYPDPDRLALVVTHFDRGGNEEVGQTGATWELLRDGVPSMDFAALTGGFGSTGGNPVVKHRPAYGEQQRVSAGLLPLVGRQPAVRRRVPTAGE